MHRKENCTIEVSRMKKEEGKRTEGSAEDRTLPAEQRKGMGGESRNLYTTRISFHVSICITTELDLLATSP